MKIRLILLSACLYLLAGIYRRLGELLIAMDANTIAALEVKEELSQSKPVMVIACKGIGMRHPSRN